MHKMLINATKNIYIALFDLKYIFKGKGKVFISFYFNYKRK